MNWIPDTVIYVFKILSYCREQESNIIDEDIEKGNNYYVYRTRTICLWDFDLLSRDNKIVLKTKYRDEDTLKMLIFLFRLVQSDISELYYFILSSSKLKDIDSEDLEDFKELVIHLKGKIELKNITYDNITINELHKDAEIYTIDDIILFLDKQYPNILFGG